MPFEQIDPAAQTCPQAPQLFTSRLRFVSQPFVRLPSQLPKPAEHVPVQTTAVPLNVHTPKKFAAAQASPTALPVQMSCATTHEPFEHTPDGQCVPQVPQLFGSVLVLTQLLAQIVCPGGHAVAVAHPPLMQVWPSEQVLPQAPQFEGSIAGTTQSPLQRSIPGGHVGGRHEGGGH